MSVLEGIITIDSSHCSLFCTILLSLQIFVWTDKKTPDELKRQCLVKNWLDDVKWLLMLLGSISLTCLVLFANEIHSQQITFGLQHELTPEKSQGFPKDVRFSSGIPQRSSYTAIRTKPTTVYRPRSLEAFKDARMHSIHMSQSPVNPIEWEMKEVRGPDIEDRHTLAQLARMSGDAYALPGRSNWWEVDHAWNQVNILSSCFLLLSSYLQ